MTETPETPTHGLAERLEADAERWDLDHCCSVDVADLRAAAAQLRQLDRIKAALPPDEIDLLISHHQDRCNVCAWSVDECDDYRILTAVVDALEADDGA